MSSEAQSPSFDVDELRQEAISSVPAEQDEDEKDVQNFDDWVEDNDEVISVKSLFNEEMLSSISALVTHDMTNYRFDLKDVMQRLCKDDRAAIMLINFIRKQVAATDTINEQWITELRRRLDENEFFNDESNMMPFLEDDPLLFLYEDNLVTFEDA